LLRNEDSRNDRPNRHEANGFEGRQLLPFPITSSQTRDELVKTACFLVVLTALSCLSPASHAADRKPNVLLICVDDLRPELACFGVSYIQSPNIDRLASTGRIFRSHYVQAPTCGASRCTLLTGCYGASRNDALFQRAAKIKADPDSVHPSMPAWFRKSGYTTVSVGKVSHHPGGRGGKDWNDDTKREMPNSWDRHLLPAGPWRHPRGWMHGLAHGEIRIDAGEMDVFPTLCDVAGLPKPDFVDGMSLLPLLDDPASPGHPAIAYSRNARTIRTETHRLILHDDGYAELYDHTCAAKETKNVAEANASLVKQLATRLQDRLDR
jgi:arylsulfatase A-like enzyme